MAVEAHHQVSCLCGTSSQEVKSHLDAGPSSPGLQLSLCHCDTCRHSSGLLCTSYYTCDEPALSQNLTSYSSSPGTTRYFCPTCGCHIFRQITTNAGEIRWEVASGVISDTIFGPEQQQRPVPVPVSVPDNHGHTADTKDGGLAIWLQSEHLSLENSSQDDLSFSTPPVTRDDETLPASCACGNVKFSVTRPNEESYLPHSGYPDLTHSYITNPTSVTDNPDNEKWWIRGHGTKYRAGTCACRSCRLASGFEIQTWAFIPRTNIFLHLSGPNPGEKEQMVPLDFVSLPSGILRSYSSSPGVLRESCQVCGATVFWHNTTRPGIIDVSAGLFKAEEGARAERWLDWFTGRVSFAEDVGNGRRGVTADAARRLIKGLEDGMRRVPGGS